MTYRATPVTQRDGSPLASSNCRLASAACGIDYHTQGATTSSGADMRARQSDQSGGTDSGDAAEAWASYGQSLRIRDGETWADAVDDLEDGRLVHLDIWAAAMAPAGCPSGTGQYGHTIAVAPEQSGTRWLVSDPWCSPAKWAWIDEVLLREAAETWGGMCYGQATSGRGSIAESVLRALMRLAAKRLMSQYRPDAPASVPPSSDTGGSAGRIMFTTTGAPSAESEEVDMPINAAPGLVTGIRARVAQGVDWFKDANLTQRGGSMSSDADVVYVGAPVGESVEGGSYAVQVNTGSIYSDGVVRPTIIYLATADADTYSVPLPGTGEVDEALDNRDAEWREWLLDGAPG
jgi:hypothetical protein